MSDDLQAPHEHRWKILLQTDGRYLACLCGARRPTIPLAGGALRCGSDTPPLPGRVMHTATKKEE